jgi:translation initiation factor 2 subunit 3
MKRGRLKINDLIEIKPGIKVKQGNEIVFKTIKTKIIGLHKGNESLSELTPGGSAAIETELDMVLGKNDILAGNVISLDGKLPEAITKTRIKFTLFPEVFGLTGHVKVEQLKPSEQLMLSIDTSITGGIVKTIKKDEFDIELKVPAIIFKGDNVGIARNMGGHWRLIGFGEIL